MKRLLALIILVGLAYFGYQYYTTSQLSLPPVLSSRLPEKNPTIPTTDVLHVLGATTSTLIARGTDFLNSATGGQAEPIINKAVSDLQDRVKDLPKEEYQKVKTEFCRDIVEEYKNRSTQQ